MKTYVEYDRQYYKYIYENWKSPILNNNGTRGVSELAVWGSHNQYSGETWRAFHTSSGWGNYYVGNYGNEYSTTMSIFMQTKNPTLVTSYSLYSPTINSNSNWGSISSTRFYGSNDCSNWIQLHSTGNIGQDSQQTFNFTNNTYYNYYQYQMTTYGSGHRDQSNVCSFSLIGTKKTVIETDISDYDYYKDTPIFKAYLKDDIYKAYKF